MFLSLSGYTCVATIEATETTVFPAEAQYFQAPYPFGIDPVSKSDDKLYSISMMSLLIGITV